MTRTLVRWLAPLALFLLTPATPALAQGTAPDELLEDKAAFILDQLRARRAEFEADPSGLHALIRDDLMPLMDVSYSSRLVLGRAGRGVSDAQLDAFSKALTSQLVERYATGLLEFRSDEQLEVLPLRGETNPKATRVRTRVALANGGFAPVDYVFRQTDEGWKVFDIVIEGISYVTTYRNQISPQVEADGIEAVTQRLATGELQLSD